MDALDILKPRRGFTQTGSYRRYTTDSPDYFEYKDVDYPSKRFGDVINNLITDDNSRVIRTIWDCGYEVNGFICTQDGKTWTIVTIIHDNKNAENLRLLQSNPSAEFVIGLQNVENPKKLR